MLQIIKSYQLEGFCTIDTLIRIFVPILHWRLSNIFGRLTEALSDCWILNWRRYSSYSVTKTDHEYTSHSPASNMLELLTTSGRFSDVTCSHKINNQPSLQAYDACISTRKSPKTSVETWKLYATILRSFRLQGAKYPDPLTGYALWQNVTVKVKAVYNINIWGTLSITICAVLICSWSSKYYCFCCIIRMKKKFQRRLILSTVKCYVQKPLAAGAPLQNLAAHNAPLSPRALANTRDFVRIEPHGGSRRWKRGDLWSFSILC